MKQDKTFFEDKKQQVFRHFRLGEHLLQRKHIKLSQLVEALNEQQKTEKQVGEILVEKGYITYETLLTVLESQHKADRLIIELIMETQNQIDFKKAE